MSVFIRIELRHYNDFLDKADDKKVIDFSAICAEPKEFLKIYAEHISQQIEYDAKTDTLKQKPQPKSKESPHDSVYCESCGDLMRGNSMAAYDYPEYCSTCWAKWVNEG